MLGAHLIPQRAVIVLVLVLVALVSQGRVPSASAAPLPNAYSTQTMIPTSYLGANASPLIEFAMIPGRTNEAIVALQTGYIYRVALDGSFAPVLWGDVHTSVNFSNGEEGLLSVAFSPDFVTDGRVYLYYTPGSPAPTILARYTATATDLNEGSVEILLSIEEFAGNHNGGHIAFDSDEDLYLSLGDGGGGGDPQEKGQSLTTLLGKVLRIDVSGATGYTIPGDNPFGDGGGPIREEIFAYGFRNPWRMMIDPLNDDVWLGDVGQQDWEEVDRVVNGGNYGWDCYEGTHPYETTVDCPLMNQTVLPRAEYSHSFGQAVTGGTVYRGTDMPELYGWYVYADFYTGVIWAVNPADTSAPIQLVDTALQIGSFSQTSDGEIIIVSYANGIHRLAPLDQDGDGDVAAVDNCPAWPNPTQNLPSWPVANDDADCDGWSRNREVFVGTQYHQQCATTTTRHDEGPPDRWPVDLDDNKVPNKSDLLLFAPVFGAMAPNAPYNARFDLTGDGVINSSDLLRYAPFFGKTCS